MNVEFVDGTTTAPSSELQTIYEGQDLPEQSFTFQETEAANSNDHK